MDVMKAVSAIIEKQTAPGVSAAWLHGGVQTLMVAGEATWVPARTQLRSGALYDLASLTKVIGTTTVFLQAVDEGRVAVDDPIRRYLPEFHQPTTFRQALTHTSGLEGYIPHRDELSPKALRQALISQLRVTTECDREVVYRDVNLLLVGWALENIYQAPIQPLIQQRVLTPLGLTAATFSPAPSRCVPTTYSPEAGLRQGLVHDPKAAILREHSGSAGLFASLDDLIRFTEFAFGQRQSAAWPRAFATILQDETTNHLGRSLGWDLREDACHRLWLYHTGYTGTFWLIQPQLKEALIVLANRVHPQPNLAFLTVRDELVANFMAAHS
ncbi:serine hydrolase domain-containing protein [Lacticaseibacillus hegangensis]|uniref:Serine hydrolase domain-containing protein n=1 Tax=Lacticaseibacillus hegangensis TaxID=2486010 RepID=A0ABW4CVL0_9LACO|nr:serine hydrolase domain-containing protein [Lacticaseibacillus hegangensis]